MEEGCLTAEDIGVFKKWRLTSQDGLLFGLR